MTPKQTRLWYLLNWLMPSATELITWTAVIIATIVSSNSRTIQRFLYLSEDSSISSASIEYLTKTLSSLVGDKLAASLSLVIFWGLIGITLYVILALVAANFGSMKQAIDTTKYAYPAGADAKKEVKHFAITVLVKLIAAGLLITVLRFILTSGLSSWSQDYRRVWQAWPRGSAIQLLVHTIAAQLLWLHAPALLARVLFLKPRLFR